MANIRLSGCLDNDLFRPLKLKLHPIQYVSITRSWAVSLVCGNGESGQEHNTSFALFPCLINLTVSKNKQTNKKLQILDRTLSGIQKLLVGAFEQLDCFTIFVYFVFDRMMELNMFLRSVKMLLICFFFLNL